MSLPERSASHQDDHYNDARDEAVANGVFFDCRKLLVRHCNRTGEPRVCLVLWKNRGGGFTNGHGRRLPGLNRPVVEVGTYVDEAAKLAWQCRPAFCGNAPGKACGPAGQHVLQRVRGQIENARKIIDVEIARLDAKEAVLEAGDKPT